MSSSVARLVAAATFVACVTGCVTRSPRCPKTPKTHTPKVAHCLPPRQHAIDLTHLLQEGMPTWPDGVPFKMTRLAEDERGSTAQKLELGGSTGTHIDASANVVAGSTTVDQLPVDQLVVQAVMIDVSAQVKNNPDYRLSANDVVDWEAVRGPIPVGSLVIANTGWHKRYSAPDQYLNQDAHGVMHFPGFSPEAAELLLEREVMGIGIDTLSVDGGAAKQLDTHRVMLGAKKIQIENLANLDALPEVGATVIIGVLPVANGAQAQARVIALVPDVEEGKDEEPAEDQTSP